MPRKSQFWSGITNSHYYLLSIAFFSGMAVMGVEICAGRLMAPYFGTSLSVWTVIIGSTMIALTVGYYFGGVLSERYPRLSVLSTILVFASLFIIFLPYLTQPIMEVTLARFVQESQTSGGNNAIMVSLAVCGIVISAPVVILGMTSPFLIHLDSMKSGSAGRISGRIFAFSTIGSILGTFLPAFLLIPLVGIKFSFLLFGGLLLCTTVWSIQNGRAVISLMAIIALVIGFILAIQGLNARNNRHLIHQEETNYQLVRIFRVDQNDKKTGSPRQNTFLLTDAGLGLQSLWVEGQSFTDSWQDLFPVIPRAFDICTGSPPKDLLVLGLGGACAPYLISQFYPEISIDGVEIDGGLIKAARPYFPFSSTKNLKIFVNDARFFLRSTNKKYDVIIVDTFRPPLIPAHLATVEFFKQVRERLTDRGIMGMNIGSTADRRVFRGIANTISGAFPYVYFAKYFSREERSRLFTSYLIIASASELSLDNPELEIKIFSPANSEWREIFEKMRDRAGFEADQSSYFRRVRFEPETPFFTDDISSLETIAENEFLSLILGRDLKF